MARGPTLTLEPNSHFHPSLFRVWVVPILSPSVTSEAIALFDIIRTTPNLCHRFLLGPFILPALSLLFLLLSVFGLSTSYIALQFSLHRHALRSRSQLLSPPPQVKSREVRRRYAGHLRFRQLSRFHRQRLRDPNRASEMVQLVPRGLRSEAGRTIMIRAIRGGASSLRSCG